MKTKNLIMLVAAVALVAVVHVSFAQTAENKPVAEKENWVLLGSHVVDFTLDRDVVSLKESTEAYTALKFKVNNGPINLHKCTVHFANGETQDVTFSANANEPRKFDLFGNVRKIEKITFWYDTKNSADKKAVVEVWGRSGQIN